MKNPSSLQFETLEHIHQFISEHGFSPTIRELVEMADLKSPAPIQQRLRQLGDRGLVKSMNGASRTLRLTEEGEEMIKLQFVH
jgi:repressor LexA